MVEENILFLCRSLTSTLFSSRKIYFNLLCREQWENSLAKRNAWVYVENFQLLLTLSCIHNPDECFCLEVENFLSVVRQLCCQPWACVSIIASKKKIFDSKMINYWSTLYMMANVSINSLTQWSHLIVNSWSKFGLPLDNFSLAASDLVLISLAEMGLTERKVRMTTKDKFETWFYYPRKKFKSQYLSIITVIIFYNV